MGEPVTPRAQLSAAIKADPRSQAQIARAAGMDPTELSRLLREHPARDAALSTWEQAAGALGLRVALVPVAHPSGQNDERPLPTPARREGPSAARGGATE